MSTIDTYNEKFLVINKLDNELNSFNNIKTRIENNITYIDTKITAKNSEKTIVDADFVVAQSNLPTDIPGYQTKYLTCLKVDQEVASLNDEKTFMNTRLTFINDKITNVTAAKVIADAELSTAESAL